MESWTEDIAAEAAPLKVLRVEILTAILELGFTKEDIEGIEYRSAKKWFVVFANQGKRNLAVGKTVQLHEKEVILEHPNPIRRRENKYTKVRVFGFPLDSEKELLRKALAFYGEVRWIKDLTDNSCDIKTGIREALIEIKHQIPSYLYAGKYQIGTEYFGQVKTCRKCHQSGHFGRDCKAGVTCKECGSTDHKKVDCPNLRCYHCHEKGHVEDKCPQYWEEHYNNEEEDDGKKTPTVEDDSENFEDLGKNLAKSWAEICTTQPTPLDRNQRVNQTTVDQTSVESQAMDETQQQQESDKERSTVHEPLKETQQTAIDPANQIKEKQTENTNEKETNAEVNERTTTDITKEIESNTHANSGVSPENKNEGGVNKVTHVEDNQTKDKEKRKQDDSVEVESMDDTTTVYKRTNEEPPELPNRRPKKTSKISHAKNRNPFLNKHSSVLH